LNDHKVESRSEPLIFVIAGEQSGDNLAARLLHSLKRKTGGNIRFAGVGGAQSEREGLQSLFPMRELSLMGLAEVLPHLPRLIRRIKQTAETAKAMRPDAVVTVDSPSFTLRVAERLRGSGIPVIHYVAPQLWAWRPGRVRKLVRRVDHLMALLPFETEFFAGYGLDCSYVGHPVLESGADKGDGAAFRRRRGIPDDTRLLSVVPGSRHGELRRHLPIFAEALRLLSEKHPDLCLVVPVLESTAPIVEAAAKDWPNPAILVAPEERFDAFAACDAAIAKSGTVTLELALANVPMVVAYRINPATAFVVRRLVTVPHASLVNLLTKREVIPERLQENCTPQKLAEMADSLLSDPAVGETQRKGFAEAFQALGGTGAAPSDRAADLVLGVVAAASPRPKS
jgi:lipid-A-disaccharide synthase